MSPSPVTSDQIHTTLARSQLALVLQLLQALLHPPNHLHCVLGPGDARRRRPLAGVDPQPGDLGRALGLVDELPQLLDVLVGVATATDEKGLGGRRPVAAAEGAAGG